MFEKKIDFNFKITQEVINKISFIDGFKGKWEAGENKNSRYLNELKRMATIESIGSSTRIEGATLSDKEVAQLIQQVKITEFKTRDEEEVFGYYDVLDIIFENYETLDLTENNIKQLHGLLLKYSSKDQRHRGEYKQLTNQVVANYPGGLQRTIFKTTLPHLTEKEMSEMIQWVNEKSEKKDIHPLIIIGLFIYEFLSIHPFQDGNGRLSRLLTTLLLLRHNYPFIQYLSLEHIIEERKKDYYSALMNGQQNRNTNDEIIHEWILFFLNCLELLIRKLEIKIAYSAVKSIHLNDRHQQIKILIENRNSVKLNDIVTALKDISVNTIKKDLKFLLNENIIERIGNGKASAYLLK